MLSTKRVLGLVAGAPTVVKASSLSEFESSSDSSSSCWYFRQSSQSLPPSSLDLFLQCKTFKMICNRFLFLVVWLDRTFRRSPCGTWLASTNQVNCSFNLTGHGLQYCSTSFLSFGA
mmetsp:Transcript_2367/g.3962  ORF Transcript_2367/g.3962 Transcript_2367/m.3962 type:complete len:117 (-) Transcript_2367:323-673(-)